MVDLTPFHLKSVLFGQDITQYHFWVEVGIVLLGENQMACGQFFPPSGLRQRWTHRGCEAMKYLRFVLGTDRALDFFFLNLKSWPALSAGCDTPRLYPRSSIICTVIL